MKIFNQIQIMRRVHSVLLDKIASKYNLNECEIMILMFLDENVDQDMATDIVKNLMISKAHVSGLVNNLEAQKYISRRNDTRDKKKIHLEITEKAKPIIKAVKIEKNKMKNIIFDGMTEEEFETMKIVLNRIKKNLKNSYGVDIL